MNKDGWRTSNKALTDKQKEILPFLADGKSDRYISVELEISVLAVQQRIERVMDIAKCADRDDLVEYAKEYIAKEKWA